MTDTAAATDAKQKTVTRVVKFCIDTKALTDHQRVLFERHAGTSRAVWNWALAEINDQQRKVRLHVRDQAASATDGTHDAIVEKLADKEWSQAAYVSAKAAHPTPHHYTAAGFDKRFTELATSGDPYGFTRDGDPRTFGWWKAEKHGVSRNAVNQPLRALERAVADYYTRPKTRNGRSKRKDGMPSGWPTFKSKHDPGAFSILNLSTRGSRKVLDDGSSSAHRLYFPSLGSIRVFNDIRRLRRMVKKGGVPKTAHFTQAADRWYVSITVSFDVNNPYVAPRPTSKRQRARGVVGVDLGVTVLAATNEGEMEDRLKPARDAHDKMVRAQRALLRKQKGSNGSRKAKTRIAKLHHLVALKRATAQHHLTKKLATTCETVVIEDLQLTQMTKRAAPKPDPDRPGHYLPNRGAAKSGLNRSMLDVGMREIRRQLEYKSVLYGSTLETVNPVNTSRRCAACGYVALKNRKSQADFRCDACGHGDNADVNAAINIRNRHLGLPGAPQGQETTPGDRAHDPPPRYAVKASGGRIGFGDSPSHGGPDSRPLLLTNA